jgi:2-hydroxychromene-2-carboxylate isomerase
MSLPATLDFWLEYDSTYSYLAAERIGTMAKRAGVAVRWRPFLLGPIFQAQGWNSSPFNIYPQKGEYMWRDMARLCESQGLPLQPPDKLKTMKFPQNSVLAARVAMIGFSGGWGEDFSRRVYRAQFGDGKDIGDGETIAGILQAMRHDPAAIVELAQADDNKLALRKQTEEAQRLKIFGAPSFVVQNSAGSGELFWGNDRLEDALAWSQR